MLQQHLNERMGKLFWTLVYILSSPTTIPTGIQFAISRWSALRVSISLWESEQTIVWKVSMPRWRVCVPSTQACQRSLTKSSVCFLAYKMRETKWQSCLWWRIESLICRRTHQKSSLLTILPLMPSTMSTDSYHCERGSLLLKIMVWATVSSCAGDLVASTESCQCTFWNSMQLHAVTYMQWGRCIYLFLAHLAFHRGGQWPTFKMCFPRRHLHQMTHSRSSTVA